jgi:hypothetical protein
VVVGCGATGFFRAVMYMCRLVRGTEIARRNSREVEREDQGRYRVKREKM